MLHRFITRFVVYTTVVTCYVACTFALYRLARYMGCPMSIDNALTFVGATGMFLGFTIPPARKRR